MFRVLTAVAAVTLVLGTAQAQDAYPSLENGTNAMDLVLCRNVLMYFEPKRAHQMLQGLQSVLADGGWLVLGEAESAPALDALECVPVGGSVFYRKRPLLATAHGPQAPVPHRRLS